MEIQYRLCVVWRSEILRGGGYSGRRHAEGRDRLIGEKFRLTVPSRTFLHIKAACAAVDMDGQGKGLTRDF